MIKPASVMVPSMIENGRITTRKATLTTGPSFVGGFVRYTANGSRTPVGTSLAPRIARVFEFADAHAGTGIGVIEPALPRR